MVRSNWGDGTDHILRFLGIFLYVGTFISIIVEKELFSASFITPTGQRVSPSPAIIIQFLIGSYLMQFAQLFFGIAIG